jgi:class 3 adenylate cyclase
MMKQNEVSLSQSQQTSGPSAASTINVASMKHHPIYGLFDHLTQAADLPRFISALALLWFILQNALVSLWSPGSVAAGTPSPLRALSEWLFVLTSFMKTSPSLDRLLFSFLAIVAVFVAGLAAVGASVLRIVNRRAVVKAILCIGRFFLEIVLPIIAFALAGVAGIATIQAMDGNSEAFIYLGVSLVILGSCLAMSYYVIGLLGASPYLPSSVFAFFSTSVYRTHVLALPVLFFFSIVARGLSSWFNFVIIAVHCGFMIGFMIGYSYRPFVVHPMNCLSMGICLFGIMMDIVIFALRVTHTSEELPVFILVFLLPVVSAAAVFLFDHYTTLRMNRKFAECRVIPVSDEEAVQRFTEMGLSRSKSRALFFVNYAIANRLMGFYHPFFMNIIVKRWTTPSVLTDCARVMAWLPEVSRSLSVLCAMAVGRSDLGIEERFVCFQLERIRLGRESWSSASSSDKLLRLKTDTIASIQMMHSFWERSECSVTALQSFSRHLETADAIWKEAIADSPNAVSFHDTYATFLIEAPGHFSEAIVSRWRAEMIESGANFRIDHCFRRFVRRLPSYLTQGVLDVHGRFVRSSGQTGSQMSDVVSFDALDSVDSAREKHLGHTMLPDARVRLTVEHTLDGRRASALTITVSAIAAIASAYGAAFLTLYFYFSGYFDTRTAVAERINHETSGRLFLVACVYCWMYFWGTTTGSIDDSFLAALEASDASTDRFFPAADSWGDRAMYFNRAARTQYKEIMASINRIALNGLDVTRYAGPLFDEKAWAIRFCDDAAVPADWWSGNVRTAWPYHIIQASMFLSVPDPHDWFTVGNGPLCTVLASLHEIVTPLADFRESLSSLAIDDARDADRWLKRIEFVLPSVLLVFSLALWATGSLLYRAEIARLTALLLGLPKDVRRSCAERLRRDVSDDPGAPTASVGGGCAFTIAEIGVPIIWALCAALTLVQLNNISDYNDLYRHLNEWVVLARDRKCHLFEGTISAILSILDHHPGIHHLYHDSHAILSLIEESERRLSAANKELLEGSSDGNPGTVGFDPELDVLSLEPQCDPPEDPASWHDAYRCASTMMLMHFAVSAITGVARDSSRFNGHLDGTSDMGETVHLLDAHLMPVVLRIDEQYGQLNELFEHQFKSYQAAFFVGEFCALGLGLLLAAFYCKALNSAYDVLLALIRRVPPAKLLASPPLEKYLLRRATRKRVGMSVDERTVAASVDGIVCAGSGGIITEANPAAVEMLRSQEEQVLGQQIPALFEGEASARISAQMQLMSERQAAPLFEGHALCIGGKMCAISLLAVVDGGEIGGYVAILRDEGQLMAQQAEVEAAKAEAERLLYQILPRTIVARLNAGEKDITFSVPLATVGFIDIVKFSEYAMNLTPQEIMANLSLLFSRFDQACAAHPLLMKIKLIGDVYMAAGGLFDEVQPQEHATQMLLFGLSALEAVEDVNEALGAALSVRIGVNTGGPIIAGVLGVERPTFDIIGDPINVAARLQSTGIPKKIQISSEVKSLVDQTDFVIKYRGEIDLKGKGNTKTYLVDPPRDKLSLLSASLEDLVRL